MGGRYRLVRELGHGAMGSVWLALDTQLERSVAVKVMQSDHRASPGSSQRLAREARAVAQLTSPHVVQVHDYGVDGEVPFIVMEVLRGEDLESRLARQPRLPAPVLAALLAQAAAGLDQAHAAGIVHRDLKPANIFLTRVESAEVVKLLDFGVAAVALQGEPSCDAAYFLGTPAYASPEQTWGSSPVDHRSDLWSLGVVAYRALTGRLPFSARSDAELLVQLHAERPTPPSSIAPEIGPAVDRFFDRALARNPADRFQHAGALAAAFRELVETGGLTRQAKILIIDDEPDAVAMMTQHYRDKVRRGVYELVFAANGMEALERLRDNPDTDLALADLYMPKLDGLGFMERATEIAPFLKTIVVSAFGDTGNVRAAMNRGAFDFLVKPLDLDDLDVTIEKTLRHVSSQRRNLRFTEENSILRMFLSSSVLDRALPALRAAAAPPVERQQATVAVMGVFGFEEASSAMPASAAVAMLNASFEVIVPEVASRGGVVERVVGEAVIAVFSGANHLLRALDACVRIRSRVDQLGALAAFGPPFAGGIAVGLDTGAVIAGALGSVSLGRLDYTVLGSPARTAGELQRVAASGQILVTRAVAETLPAELRCEALPDATRARLGDCVGFEICDVVRTKG